MKSLSPLVLLAFLATGLVACCSSAHPPDAPVIADLRTHAERAEARSVAMLDEDGDPDCGGVWVDHAQIVTAFHCVADTGKPVSSSLLESLGLDDPFKDWTPVGQKVGYRSHDGDRRMGRVKAVDVKHDLALIDALADVPAHDIAPVSGRLLHDGEDLDIIGSTAGKAFTYSHCYVASTRKTDFLQVSGPVYLGNSGGGAFDDAGHLVGIADKMIGSLERGIVPDMSFFIPGQVIRDFLNAAAGS